MWQCSAVLLIAIRYSWLILRASLRILGWQVLQSEFAFFNSYSLKFQMRGSRPTFGEPESL